MSFTSVRLREAWNWGGLTAKELGIRTYRAMDKHETLDRAAVVAFYALLSLAPLLGILLAVAVGRERGVSAELLAPRARSCRRRLRRWSRTRSIKSRRCRLSAC